MSFMSRIGFKKDITDETKGCCHDEVLVQDGKIIGNPYNEFGMNKKALTPEELELCYERVSCIGSGIDLISSNMQMVEPVFWDDEHREAIEYPSNKKLKELRRLFENPSSVDNRKTFIEKSVKNYKIHGIVYYAFIFDNNDIVSIRILDNCLVTAFEDRENNRINYYVVNNHGVYSGEYVFNGRYYVNSENKNIVLAPYINSSPTRQYMPSSPLLGAGIEALMYWYGCFHNKSLLQNGARPSMILLIKSLLNPQHREQLKSEIKVKHSGAGNAGSAMIIDGAADKEIKQLSQNNKDMEFSTVLRAAEEAVNMRLGTNWIMGKNLNAKDYQQALEMFYDMTVCPLFQGIYNHIFDVYKYYNSKFSGLRITFLEQDIPALRPRFLQMMKDMPNLGIFTIKERRKMYNYAPLGDQRDDELTVQTVKVTQSGMSGTNETAFSGGEGEE